MNCVKIIILTLAVTCGVLCATGQSSDAVVRDKMTNAVMKVYDDHLAQNPNDYNVLFARAHQHYYDGDYTAALTDLNQALMLTPKTDKELRFDEYILRARISDARQDYTGELADLRLAQELQPKSLPCTDMIAKANLKIGNLGAAEKAFKTILRAESMNYDAMYGLAQVYQARGNDKDAINQVTKAVDLFRVEPQVYVNRADIYARQGNIPAAVRDLLQGMSVGDGGVAVQRLFEMSDLNYDGVMNSLAEIADLSIENGGQYRYLRANVAIDHCRYRQALDDLYQINRTRTYDSPNVDYNIAKCCLEMARYDEALNHVNQAITRDPGQPEYYLVKSLAEYYAGNGGNYDAAMEALELCSLTFPQYEPMLTAKASLLCSQGKDNEALGYLNAAVANDPNSSDALIARGLLLKRLGYDKLATRDLNTVALMGDDPQVLKGVALDELSRESDAFAWLRRITATSLPGGENFYYAALFMAAKGDNYRALDFLQTAVDNGFGSVYRMRDDVLSQVSLKSLRSESQFELLMDKARLLLDK